MRAPTLKIGLLHRAAYRARTLALLALGAAAFPIASARAQDEGATPSEDPAYKASGMDPRARKVPHDPEVFRPDPVYPEGFSLDEQLRTYAKAPVKTQRPLLELGREMYVEGALGPGLTFLGEKNLVFPSLIVYGDWRGAAGFSDNGTHEVGRVSTRLNLDVDFQITATERLHAFFRPLDKNGRFTGYDFAGDDRDSEGVKLNLNAQTLFFEGDAGAIAAGVTDRESSFDLPFAVGKIPLLLQNGVWVEDAFWGGAFSLAARNSPRYDISNYDLTFFVGLDDVSNPGLRAAGASESNTAILGVTTFMDVAEGYVEAGYGYTSVGGNSPDADYHNLTASFTKRYRDWLSNSTRVIWNVGQSLDGPETNDGVLLLAENSFRTRQPYTFIPYANLFVGFGRPQSLARAADAGGVLKNTGVNFETNALTLFPKLDDTGHDAFGGAFGVNYLFDLEQRRQLVLEVAAQHPFGGDASAGGDQFAVGARYQLALDHSWILRFDLMAASLEGEDDLFGFAIELRKKF